ncbi:MAG: serine/threonine-protein kinase [Planctomycetota bacterium]
MTDKNKCPSRKWLEKLIDGNVTQEQESKLARHLDHCDICKETLESMGEFQALTQTDPIFSSEPLKKINNSDKDLIQRKLLKIRSNPPSKSNLNSGFADVAPWLGESDKHLGKIAEFELVRFIGRGGMGLVFEAFDNKLQREVAIKLMSPSLLADPNASERFLREARSAAKINHINVITVHGVDQVHGLPYLVMELVLGKSLDELFKKSEKLSIDEILKIARQTALGLHAAHRQGIIHRDIKPSNIMVDRNSRRIKIADFGLASTLNDPSFTQTGFLVGTPDFISPEQVQSKPVDARSDLFSLGSVLFLICTGELPFSKDTLVATLDSVCNRQLPRIDSSRKDIPAELASIVQRLTQKNPADRYRSADELLIAIQKASQSQKSVTSSNSKIHNSFYWQRIAMPTIVALVACVLAWIVILNWPAQKMTRELAGTTASSELTRQASEQANRNANEELGAQDLENGIDEEQNRLQKSAETQTIAVETSQQLIVALEEDANEVIYLEPGKTYRISENIHIESRDILIESDPDDHAKIVVDSFEDEPMLTFENCHVTFRSVNIHDLSEARSEEAVVTCSSGMLQFDDVFFVSKTEGTGFEIADSKLIIESSIFTSPETLFTIYPMPDQVITVQNSVLASESCFGIGGPSQIEFVTRESYFINYHLFSLPLESEDAFELDEDLDNAFVLEISIRFNAFDSIFESARALINLELDDNQLTNQVLQNAPKRLEWKILACKLPVIPLLTETHEEEKLLEWEDFGLEPDSESAKVDIYEASVNSMIEKIADLKFGSISQIKELISLER